MRPGRNLFVGLGSSVWSALIGLAVVPFYLRHLGVESYGLIGFFVTVQALLQLLDMGMTPTLNREVARCSATGDLGPAGNLLHTLAVIYWASAVAIMVAAAGLAPLIAEYWLSAQSLPKETVRHAVMLMGVVAFFRWPIGLYQAAIIGAQRLDLSSTINVVWLTIASGGAVAILNVLPRIEAFFMWQACVSALHAMTMRLAAWRVMGRPKHRSFDLDKLKTVWRFTLSMSVIAFMGAIFTQLDKVLLSKFLLLEDFAQYMLATLVVSGLYVLVTPVYNLAFPALAKLAVSGDLVELREQYGKYTRLMVTLLLPPALFVGAFPEEIVQAWTGDSKVALAAAPLVTLLAIGSTLNGIMTIPHALQLALGKPMYPLIVNGLLLGILLPLIVYLAMTHGAVGGALAWATLNVFYVLLSTWLTHTRLLVGGGVAWLGKEVLLPACFVLVLAVVTKDLCIRFDLSLLQTLLAGAAVSLLAFLSGVSRMVGLAELIRRGGVPRFSGMNR